LPGQQPGPRADDCCGRSALRDVPPRGDRHSPRMGASPRPNTCSAWSTRSMTPAAIR
jgi:hypothetical protein